MATNLDPKDYGDYSQEVSISITGAHIRWKGVPAAERHIFALIREQMTSLSAAYDVSIKTGKDFAYLTLEFMSPPTPAQVRSLKGEVFAILMVTSWGGP